MFINTVIFVCFTLSLSSTEPTAGYENLRNAYNFQSPNACTLPPYPENGHYTTNAPEHTPGQSTDLYILNVTCNDGYELLGDHTVYCFLGLFTPEKMPECVPLPPVLPPADQIHQNTPNRYPTCTLPPYPENGRYFVANDPNATPGQTLNVFVLNVTCNEGYELIGNSHVHCFVGIWSPNELPTCTPLPTLLPAVPAAQDSKSEKLRSSAMCTLPSYPENGWYTVANHQSATPGKSLDMFLLNVTCREGYQVVGDSYVHCHAGVWAVDQLPTCAPVENQGYSNRSHPGAHCKLIRDPNMEYFCDTPDNRAASRPCEEYEPAGTVARPKCKPNFTYNGDLLVMNCIDGSWDNTPACVPDSVDAKKEGTKIIIVIKDKVEIYIGDL